MIVEFYFLTYFTCLFYFWKEESHLFYWTSQSFIHSNIDSTNGFSLGAGLTILLTNGRQRESSGIFGLVMQCRNDSIRHSIAHASSVLFIHLKLQANSCVTFQQGVKELKMIKMRNLIVLAIMTSLWFSTSNKKFNGWQCVCVYSLKSW